MLLQLAIAALVLLDDTTAVRTVTIVHNATTCHGLATECTTLEKCLQNISTCFSSNTLVKFQAGTYNGSAFRTSITIETVQNLTLLGKVTHDHGNTVPATTIERAAFSFINVTRLRIGGISFVWNSILIDTAQHFLLAHVHVYQSNGYGLYIRNAISNSVIIQCHFNNASSSNVKIEYNDFAWSQSTGFPILKILNTRISHAQSGGVRMSFSQTTYTVAIIIDSCIIEQNNGPNVYIQLGSHLNGSSRIILLNTTIQNGAAKIFQQTGLGLHLSNTGPSDQTSGLLRLINVSFAFYQATTSSFMIGGSKCFSAKFHVEIHNSSFAYSTYDSIQEKFSVGSLRRNGIVKFHNCDGNGPSYRIIVYNSSFANNFMLYSPEDYTYSNAPINSVVYSVGVQLHFLHCTFANNTLTALQLFNTFVFFYGNNLFYNNSGTNGGAISTTQYTNGGILVKQKIFLMANATVNFYRNRALHCGGALYIQTDAAKELKGLKTIAGKTSAMEMSISLQYCVIRKELGSKLSMIDNKADEGGDSIYMNNVHHISYALYCDNFTEFFGIPQPWALSEIASNPTVLCLCRNNTPIYYQSEYNVSIYPGASFSIPVAAVGTYNGTTQVTVHWYPSDATVVSLPQTQVVQSVGKTCTNLKYEMNVYQVPAETEMKLFMIEEKNLQPFVISLKIKGCEVGFKLTKTSPYICDCSPFIHSKPRIFSCDTATQTITKERRAWISYDNTSQKLLIHNFCPFDYCNPFAKNVSLTKAESQCAFQRAGILCGSCKPGLSLALGSSQCLKCSHKFLSLIVVFLVAGIVLVVILNALDLTVASGIINGLIFYANIVKANDATFFPKQSFLSVFVAWLNIDLGIETCFYNGLDGYVKTWLQFAFPTFVWLIVLAIIILSRYSITIAKLSGNSSVPVLATLFILSYAKLQRTIITAFSFTHVQVEDGEALTVWLYDGNVRFLNGKHIPLFLAALLFLVAYIIPLTILLLAAPFLQSRRQYYVVKFVNKIKPLLDAYQGPYKNRYRFWTGVLLLVRVVLLTCFAFNTLGDPGVNLLVTQLVLLAIIPFTVRGIYNKTGLNVLESFYLINLEIFASWTLFNQYMFSDETLLQHYQAVASYTMVGSCALVFLASFLVVSFQRVKKTRCFINYQRKKHNSEKLHAISITNGELLGSAGTPACPAVVAPTVTFVELREPLLTD